MLTLYSRSTCPFSHRCRMVLYEKDMDFEILDVDDPSRAEDVAFLTPYNTLPVLVERELNLYEASIICEYIDERFPHPQLMPIDPVRRAQTRLLLFQFEKELFIHVRTLENATISLESRKRAHAREGIRQSLAIFASLFKADQYVFGADLSMVDIAMATLMWRFEHYHIKPNKSILPVLKYAERLFQRKSFLDSLTAPERAMRR